MLGGGTMAIIGLILGDFIIGAAWNLFGILFEVQVYRFWY